MGSYRQESINFEEMTFDRGLKGLAWPVENDRAQFCTGAVKTVVFLFAESRGKGFLFFGEIQ